MVGKKLKQRNLKAHAQQGLSLRPCTHFCDSFILKTGKHAIWLMQTKCIVKKITLVDPNEM